MRRLWNKIRLWALKELLRESGVDVSPDPDIWGILSQTEEENVLARLWDDKEWVALMRVYAEGANKALIARTDADKDFWQFKAKFMAYNSLIIKSRRAAKKLYARKDHNSPAKV